MKTRIAPALRWIAAALFLCVGGSVLRPQDDNSNPNINKVPANIAIFSGNHQLGIEWYLDAPLVVQVTDNNGNPLPGINVSFLSDAGMLARDNVGSGYNLAQDCITGGDGCAQVFLDLRGPPGTTNHVTASIQSVIDGQSGTTTKTVAFECFVPQLIVVSGKSQMGASGSWLPTPLKVRLGSAFGGTMYYAGAGLQISFQVTANNGLLSRNANNANASSAITLSTDDEGYAQVNLKLTGTDAGTLNSVNATFSTYRGTNSASIDCYTNGVLAVSSGAVQAGPRNVWLPEPLKVLLSDSNGKAMPAGLPVHFRVSTGWGSIRDPITGNTAYPFLGDRDLDVITDVGGYAQVLLYPAYAAFMSTRVQATPGTSGNYVQMFGYEEGTISSVGGDNQLGAPDDWLPLVLPVFVWVRLGKTGIGRG